MTAETTSEQVTKAAEGSVATPRPLRADAAKNRERILEAAEATFTAEGVAAPIDAVAQRAGVGVGTVYRHFPTKEALFEAIVTARLDDLCVKTRRLAEGERPGDALFSFLREFGRQASAKQDLFDAMDAAGIDIKSTCATSVEELTHGIDVLLEQAKRAGAVRGDVATAEVMALIVGACHSKQDDVVCQRMVEIVCDGIRTPAAAT
ncbi:MAG TPA: TetR/AcrR family transcriptional regulator [Solirubrobacteraceae bacterium]|jgi:AcrR family transcriptional regulator|nr:TetR/AcrR family transcriptional regulator [Solirubrobacteraceae bacterium]